MPDTPSTICNQVWDWRSYVSSEHGPSSSTTRHVLLALSIYMSSKGDSCFPSVATLVKDTGLTKPTVVKHLKKAHQEGWIQKSKHGYGGKGWARNEYRATVPTKAVKQVNRERQGGKANEQGGKADTEKAVKQVNPNSPSNNSPREGARARGAESAGEERQEAKPQANGNTEASPQHPESSDTLEEPEQAGKGSAEENPLGRGIDDPANHPGVKAYGQYFKNYRPNDYQRGKIALTLTRARKEEQRRGRPYNDACQTVMQRWHAALDYWKSDGYGARKIGKMLNKFREVSKQAWAEEAVRRSNGRARAQQPHVSGSGKQGRAVC